MVHQKYLWPWPHHITLLTDKPITFLLSSGLLEEYSEDTESIHHYRRLLTSQTARLTEMCTTWEKVAEDRTIPEDIEVTMKVFILVICLVSLQICYVYW